MIFLPKIEKLINGIALLQSKGDAYFSDGLFPSFRQNKYLNYSRRDNNIFYSASIIFILNELQGKLPSRLNAIIEQISKKVVDNYPNFQNKDGLKTYNFWQTKPSKHFSNGYVFHRFDHFRIPDDIDDTALIYLTNPHSLEEVEWLKAKLKVHANLANRKIKNTPKHYRHLKVYSTWFGKNMPIEFDVCALCNLMCLFEKYQFPYNENDIDTYQFLREVILRNEFVQYPFKISHNYASSAIIIYHYARLIGTYEPSALDGCKELLIERAVHLLAKTANEMEQIILETSLLKLTKSDHLLVQKYRKREKYSPFRYFIAGLLSSYENPFLYFFASFAFTQMSWHCDAHELALRVENLVLKSIYSHRNTPTV